MSRPRCAETWPDGHGCARPPSHPPPHMCYCGQPLDEGELVSLEDIKRAGRRAWNLHHAGIRAHKGADSN